MSEFQPVKGVVSLRAQVFHSSGVTGFRWNSRGRGGEGINRRGFPNPPAVVAFAALSVTIRAKERRLVLPQICRSGGKD